MPIKRWNTIKIAGWGAALGMVYALGRNVMEGHFTAAAWSYEMMAYVVGGVFGEVAGVAVLFGLVSGLRNLILRAK